MLIFGKGIDTIKGIPQEHGAHLISGEFLNRFSECKFYGGPREVLACGNGEVAPGRKPWVHFYEIKFLLFL
jgi:hypothetical protein